MAPNSYQTRLLNSLVGMAAAMASLPLALICADSLFGLGSLLVVPAFAVGLVFALQTRDPGRRAWWFGFSVTVGLCLPLCFRIELGLHSIAIYLQRLDQHGTISLSQRVLGPTLIVLIVLVPFFAVGLIGLVADRLTRRIAGYARSSEMSDTIGKARWRLTMRELLAGVAALCLLLAWNSSWVKDWQVDESGNQSAFLARFESSFISGDVKLLAAPTIDELQRTLIPESRYMSFRPLGVNEYRVIAPIEKNGRKRWAVWSYTCNGSGEKYNYDGIYQFAYAEADTRVQLPSHPWPARRYIQWSNQMLDGIPITAGPSATIVSLTNPVAVDQPVTLVISAPAGTICDVEFFPSNALLQSIPSKSPDKLGAITWTWYVTPESTGGSYSVKVLCKEPHGAFELANSTSMPNLQVLPAQKP